MQIIVNNEALDVTLENEKNLGEIFASLQNWMAEGGMYPLDIQVDGTEININEQSTWQHIALDDIDEFKLEAGTYNDVQKQQLVTVMDYLNLLLTLSAQMTKEDPAVAGQFASAMSEYEYIRMALPAMLQLDNAAFSSDFVKLDNAAVQLDTTPDDPGAVAEFAARLEQLGIILLDRLSELNDPKTALSRTSKLLSEMLPNLEDAGIALQTGKDKDAYSFLFRISEMTAKLVRLLNNYSIETRSQEAGELTKQLDELSGLLEELNRSISDGDRVLLADLLEYDLREKLDAVLGGIGLLLGETI